MYWLFEARINYLNNFWKRLLGHQLFNQYVQFFGVNRIISRQIFEYATEFLISGYIDIGLFQTKTNKKAIFI